MQKDAAPQLGRLEMAQVAADSFPSADGSMASRKGIYESDSWKCDTFNQLFRFNERYLSLDISANLSAYAQACAVGSHSTVQH